MRIMRVIVISAFVFGLQGGVAVAAVDWLDKLSGPGPFRGLYKTYRFFCVSKISNQPNFGRVLNPGGPTTFVQETDKVVHTWLLPIDAASGIINWKPLAAEPSITATNRESVARSDCHADRRVTAYADVTLGRYWSLENALFSHDDPEADRHQVRVFDLRWSYTARVHPAVDIGAGLGFDWFSGDEFETFSRLAVTPLHVRYSPFASLGDNVKYRIFRVEVGLSTFNKGFDQDDFCNRNCTGIQPFNEERDYLWRVGFYLDFAGLGTLR
jgi:hypothetical protein